jgi:ADP-ribose pyrophosphatase YjhB (NUDIX family)
VHHWTVGGALIEGDDGLLLVRNRRRGGRHDWTPPGGVIDSGEQIVDGLAREVTEETGLTVVDWHGPAYRIEVTAVDMGWVLQVEAWRALAWQGDLRVGDDPDGIVVEARFVPTSLCVERLGRVQPWVTDPVEEWLAGRWDGVRQFSYRVEGIDPGDMVVTRT